jgi:hypothetical protein
MFTIQQLMAHALKAIGDKDFAVNDWHKDLPGLYAFAQVVAPAQPLPARYKILIDKGDTMEVYTFNMTLPLDMFGLDSTLLVMMGAHALNDYFRLVVGEGDPFGIVVYNNLEYHSLRQLQTDPRFPGYVYDESKEEKHCLLLAEVYVASGGHVAAQDVIWDLEFSDMESCDTLVGSTELFRGTGIFVDSTNAELFFRHNLIDAMEAEEVDLKELDTFVDIVRTQAQFVMSSTDPQEIPYAG